MRTLASLFSVFLVGASVTAFAASNKSQQVEAIRDDLEVKSVIAAFEKNRNQECDGVRDTLTKVDGEGAVETVVTCNQYDDEGTPMPNVHYITIKGYLYGTEFQMGSVTIVGAE